MNIEVSRFSRRFFSLLASVIFLLFLSYLVVGIVVNAQDETDEIFKNPYDIQIYISEQNFATTRFKIKVKIDSKINSSRTTLKWNLPDGLVSIDGLQEIVGHDCKISIGENTKCDRTSTPTLSTSPKSKKESFEYEIEVLPYSKVDGEVLFSIQSYIGTGKESYLVLQAAEIKTDKDLNLLPISTNTSNLKFYSQLKTISLNSFVALFVFFILLIVIKRINLYLNPPRKSSIPYNSKIMNHIENLNDESSKISLGSSNKKKGDPITKTP